MHLWKIPDDYPESLLGQYDRHAGPDRFEFKRGEPLVAFPAFSPRFTFEAKVGELRQMQDLGNNAMVPLVSSEVAQILANQCPTDVQLLPAIVAGLDGSIDDYSIVVVTHRIRGLDRERSQFTCIPGTESLLGIKRAVYTEGCLGGHDAARDEEYLSNLLVSQALVQALDGRLGIGLYAVEVRSP